MNYRFFLLLLVIFTTLSAFGQVTQPCIVRQYNQKNPKTPLGGVELNVRDANSTVSGSNGMATLTFNTLKPGDKVTLRSATKAGYEIFNTDAINQWIISGNNVPFEIVLVKSDYFAQHKKDLTKTSTANYERKYKQAKAELAKLQQAGQLKEEEYRQKLLELEDEYDNALKSLDNYIDQFARIDLSEVSEEELHILEMVDQGLIDEAVKAYEDLNITEKLREARALNQTINEGIGDLEDLRAQKLQSIAYLKETQQRVISQLKDFGSNVDLDKIGQRLKERILADSTDIDAMEEYAYLANVQGDFNEAEQFFLLCLHRIKNDPLREARIHNALGTTYHQMTDFAQARNYYLSALENYRTLLDENQASIHTGYVNTIVNLGVLDMDRNKYAEAEEYLSTALEYIMPLYEQTPEPYCEDLKNCQLNLGTLYLCKGDEAGAVEMWNKVMALDPEFPNKYDGKSELMRQLKERGLIE